jgi:phosphoenolpyruvate-protein phosphotransferase
MKSAEEKTFKGHVVSPGVARGKAFVYRSSPWGSIPRSQIGREEVGSEIERFESALEKSDRELKALQSDLRTQLGDVESGIFEAHLTLLRDPEFVRRIKQRVHSDLVNADHAVELQIQDLERALAAVGNEYLRERSQDIRDVGRRLLNHLSPPGDGRGVSLSRVPPGSVVIAEELLPSDTVELDRPNVAALVTAKGGETSHAAILARALGLPYITGIADATQLISPGDTVLVNGESETVTVAPSTEQAAAFSEAKMHYDEQIRRIVDAEFQECVTRDGVRIALFANIGRLDDCNSVKEHHLAGVGLFRTEFLFMREPAPPSLDKQHQAYSAAAHALHPLPIVIRTLDLGDDKQPAFLKARDSGKVFRGLRFSLAEPELFNTQLRAILRAADQHRNVRVLFPMVLGSEDFRQAIETLQAIARQEQIKSLPPVGAMIETPSAVFTINEILERADFVSIGTNDLTQFMLAADRSAAGLNDEYSVLQPSILRAIAPVSEAAQSQGRGVCICGEAAGDPKIAALMVGMGIRELSMSPSRAAGVSYLLRRVCVSDLKSRAQKALQAKEANSVKEAIHDLPD